jgi:hypothetical protein
MKERGDITTDPAVIKSTKRNSRNNSIPIISTTLNEMEQFLRTFKLPKFT